MKHHDTGVQSDIYDTDRIGEVCLDRCVFPLDLLPNKYIILAGRNDILSVQHDRVRYFDGNSYSLVRSKSVDKYKS